MNRFKLPNDILLQPLGQVRKPLRGNDVGAQRLLDRGAARLTAYSGPTYGLDLTAVVACARDRT